jgi:fucose permease
MAQTTFAPVVDPAVGRARARSARIAVSTLFFATGALVASYVPRLPEIRDHLALTNAELGTAIAALPIGGLLVGGFAGAVIGRFGSGRVGVIAGIGAALSIASIGLVTSWATLALAFLVYGMFDAASDAAQNSHGVGLQRVYGRSILQGIHGTWSVGGLAAAAVGALAASAGVPVAVHLGGLALAVIVALVAVAPRFLPRSVADTRGTDEADAPTIRPGSLPRLLRVLAPIALLGILCIFMGNGVTTWSAIYLTDDLGQPVGVAGAAFVAFMAAMVVGRFTNDRWVDRWGPTLVVRVGALVCTAGFVAVVLAVPLGSPGPAFLGFAAVGYGSASMFPVMVAAAGSRPGIPAAHGIAISTWLVRLGLVVSPPLIGVTADAFGLQVALLLPLAAAIAIAVLAPVLTATPRGRRTTLAEAPVAG